jgi:hypothetical protein
VRIIGARTCTSAVDVHISEAVNEVDAEEEEGHKQFASSPKFAPSMNRWWEERENRATTFGARNCICNVSTTLFPPEVLSPVVPTAPHKNPLVPLPLPATLC